MSYKLFRNEVNPTIVVENTWKYTIASSKATQKIQNEMIYFTLQSLAVFVAVVNGSAFVTLIQLQGTAMETTIRSRVTLF